MPAGQVGFGWPGEQSGAQRLHQASASCSTPGGKSRKMPGSLDWGRRNVPTQLPASTPTATPRVTLGYVDEGLGGAAAEDHRSPLCADTGDATRPLVSHWRRLPTCRPMRRVTRLVLGPNGGPSEALFGPHHVATAQAERPAGRGVACRCRAEAGPRASVRGAGSAQAPRKILDPGAPPGRRGSSDACRMNG